MTDAAVATEAPPADAAIEGAAAARAAGLRYVSDRDPGIKRLRAGAKFRYVDAQGRALKDASALARIRALAIPPAYENVWICSHPRGHLQVTGIDARGRKQYRYHAEWRSARDGSKFERMVEFGEALPRLRRRVKRDLALPGLPRDKVLAVVVALLDTTLLRIGNIEYARDNQSYGLSTLRSRHVQFLREGRARLSFRGKGGLEREVTINDRGLSRIVRRCQSLPGQQLFQYIDDDGARHGIDSEQVNAYLSTALAASTGAEFTAKDFRTWGGTLRAIALMSCAPLPVPSSERALTACINDAIKQVASELGNTPAVCRKSYINPVVFEAWREGALQKVIGTDSARAPRRVERLALVFLRQQAKAAARTAKRAKDAARTRNKRTSLSVGVSA